MQAAMQHNADARKMMNTKPTVIVEHRELEHSLRNNYKLYCEKIIKAQILDLFCLLVKFVRVQEQHIAVMRKLARG